MKTPRTVCLLGRMLLTTALALGIAGPSGAATYYVDGGHPVAKDGRKKPAKTQYAFFAGDDITFRGNYFHGSPMEQMQVWGVDFFVTWDAWIIGPSHRILIENNRCFNATHASEAEAKQLKQSSHITYRNNLFVNTIYVGVLPKEWTNITIVHNTFINCGAYPVWFQTDRQCQGAVVKNNLIPLCTANAAEVINQPEVDIVYVATPPSSHKEYVLAADRETEGVRSLRLAKPAVVPP